MQVRLGAYGEEAESPEAHALRQELWSILNRLRNYNAQLRAQFAVTAPEARGFDTNDAIIDRKFASMEEVLAGTLLLEKWQKGVEELRKGMEEFAAYVAKNASTASNLAALRSDISNTAWTYAKAVTENPILQAAVEGAKRTVMYTGAGLVVLLGFAGFLLYKVGVPVAQMWLAPPRRFSGYSRRVRRRR